MMPHHVSYQLAILGLLWLCVILHDVWPRQNVVSPQPSVQRAPPQGKHKRSNEPRPFAGLTQRPHCTLYEHGANHPEPQPPKRPAPMMPTNRRPCTIDTSLHFCPHAGCDYQGCNRLRVFRTATTAHLGREIGQEQWWRVGPSEKYVAR